MDLTVEAGVLVTDVLEDGPAEKAGFEVSDVILKYDGETVKSPRRLSKLVRKTAPGTKVKVHISRDGEEKTLTTEIGEKLWQEEEKHLFLPELDLLGIPNLTCHLWGPELWLGVHTVDLTDQLAKYFDIAEGFGVLISKVIEDTPAEKAGLLAGDVIIKADGERVDDTGDLKEVIAEHEEEEELELVIMRQGKEKKLKSTLEESPHHVKKKLVKKLKKLPHKMKCKSWKTHSYEIPEIEIEVEKALEDIDIDADLDELEERLESLEEELEHIKKELEMD
jgi:serine protease Do